MVAGGIVLTVSGPINSCTYLMSLYAGFLVPVEAHSGRWTRAPLGRERLEAITAEDFLEALVDKPGACDCRGTAQRRDRFVGANLELVVESLVDQSFDTADEDAGDRGDAIDRIAGLARAFRVREYMRWR